MSGFRSYLIGFILSLALTLLAFYVVWRHVQGDHAVFSHEVLLVVIIGLALVQLMVQSVFFLHLGRGSKTPWNLLIFLFALMVIVIVVAGSLWIMQNLQSNHSDGYKTEEFLIRDEGYQP